MENLELSILQAHQRIITRNYGRRINNLVWLERFDDLEETLIKFAGIATLWSIQKENIQNAASKDGSAACREKLTAVATKI